MKQKKNVTCCSTCIRSRRCNKDDVMQIAHLHLECTVYCHSCSSVFNSWYLFSLLCFVYVRRHSVVHCVNNGCFMRSVTSLNCVLHTNASFQNTVTLYVRSVVSKPPRLKERKNAFMHTFSLRSKLFVNGSTIVAWICWIYLWRSSCFLRTTLEPVNR